MLRDLNTKLPMAPNFRYKEFVRSSTALRLGIKNIPNEHQWQSIERVAGNIIQPVREKFGRIRITSGFRSIKLCKAIGSSINSNHTRGEAIDFEPVNSDISEGNTVFKSNIDIVSAKKNACHKNPIYAIL